MAKASLYLDTRRELSTGKYPLKLRVTHDRKTKLYPTKFSYTKEAFARLMENKRLNEAQSKERAILMAIETKANRTIESLEFFTFDTFDVRWSGKGDRNNLLSRLKSENESLEKQGKVSTASICQQTYNAVRSFAGTDTVPMLSVTPDFLKKYEQWEYSENGNSPTTVRMRMGVIKKMFNQAITAGELDPARYPFARGKYTPPQPNKSRRALDIDQITQLTEYQPKGIRERFAKDMFMFSYLSSGMNMADIFALKWSDFDKLNSFTFVRKKTKGRSDHQKPITIYLKSMHIEIIERHGGRKLNSPYVFHILNPKMTPKQVYFEVQKAVAKINIGLKSIATALEWDFNPTTYWARHSYATILMKTAPLAYISHQLGHANIATTEAYLGQFPSEDAKKYEEALLPKKTGA